MVRLGKRVSLRPDASGRKFAATGIELLSVCRAPASVAAMAKERREPIFG